MNTSSANTIQNYAYDAVVILCGGLYKTDGNYYPTTYEHGDEFGMLGGHMRVNAAWALYVSNQTKNFVFSTGISAKQIAKHGPDVPAESIIYRQVFLDLLATFKREHRNEFDVIGAPTIYLEDKSVNTAENLREVLQIIKRMSWKKVGLISSDYHIPRLEALVSLLEQQDGDVPAELVFLSAEKIVEDVQPGLYDREISAAYATEAAQLRVRNEANGLRDMREGRYVLGEFQLHRRAQLRKDSRDLPNQQL